MNKKLKISTITFLFVTLLSSTVFSQNKITIDDYNRAVGFMRENLNNKQVFNLQIRPNRFPDSTGVWYINNSRDSKKYYKITFPDEVQSELFDHDKLAKALSDSLKIEVIANDLPIDNIEYKNNEELLKATTGKQFNYNTKTNLLTIPKQIESLDNTKTVTIQVSKASFKRYEDVLMQ